MTAPSDVASRPELPPPGFYWAKLSGQSGWTTVEVTEANGLRVVDTIGWGNGGVVKEWGPALVPPGGDRGLRPGDDLHTECRDGVAYVERAWPGEITNPGGPAKYFSRPGDIVRVGDANWLVSNRTRVPPSGESDKGTREVGDEPAAIYDIAMVRGLARAAALLQQYGPKRWDGQLLDDECREALSFARKIGIVGPATEARSLVDQLGDQLLKHALKAVDSTCNYSDAALLVHAFVELRGSIGKGQQ